MKKEILLRLAPGLVSVIQRIWGPSLRCSYHGKEVFDELQARGEPFILALWHSNVLWTPWIHRGRGITVMVSASFDGELITRVVRRFGNDAVRGSTSKSGARAVRQLTGLLRGGRPVAITPDGPRGPGEQLQDGLLTLARLSGAPVIPFHYEAARQWLASSWDQHKLPKPFARMHVYYGDPVRVPADLDGPGFDHWQRVLGEAMAANARACRRAAGGTALPEGRS